MAEYPAAVYTPRTKENKAGIVYDADKKDIGYVEDVTKLDDEVVAIETELGIDPKGSSADIAERLIGITSQANAIVDAITVTDEGVKIAGLVGINASIDTENLLTIGSTRTIANLAIAGIKYAEDITITANQTSYHRGIYVNLNLIGDYNVSRTAGSGGMEGLNLTLRYDGSGTVSKATGFFPYFIVDGGGTITSLTWFKAGNPGITSGTYENITGMWLGPFTTGTVSNYGCILDTDGIGGALILGASQDAAIYYNATDIVIDPALVGSGTVDIKIAPTTGQAATSLVPFACTAYLTIKLNGVAYKVPCEAV